jgi:type I restriction enzyme S subunit
MNAPWPQVNLGRVLAHRSEFTTIDDTQQYLRCRVQLHAQGIVLRDRVEGGIVKTKKQQLCQAGEFLVAEIDAKVGGFGIVPEELDGAIVSSHYFLFSVDTTLLDRKFLGWFIRTLAFRDQVRAQGSTNYAAIRAHDVLGYTMPLPPLDEQRRIVAKIERLVERVHEAKFLRNQIAEMSDAVVPAFTRSLLRGHPEPDWVPLRTYVARLDTGKSPATQGRKATLQEWGVLKVGAVSFGTFDESENKALLPSTPPDPTHEVHAGDFLMSRANTPALVGACAIVAATRPQLLLSDKTFRFVFREPRQVIAEYLDAVLKSPGLRAQIEQAASGTSPTMKNISKEKALALMVPSLSLPEQNAQLLRLRAVQDGVTASLVAATARDAAIDALTPSVLARAFNGEL